MPVACLTGAAGGLGRAIAARLLAEGYRVALLDVSEEALASAARALGEGALPLHADVTSRESVDAAVGECERALGPVDLLINNAGTFSVCAPMWECDPELWLRDIRVNLYGTFLMCNRITGGMVERGAGRVVNVVSSGGVLDAHPYGTSYAASKSGVTRMTEGLAHELREHGVQTFAVAPPAVLTDMTRFLIEDPQARTYRPLIAEIFEKGENHPPELVAELVAVLASGRADALTGRYFLPHENYESIIADAERVVADDLWTLRISGHQKKKR